MLACPQKAVFFTTLHPSLGVPEYRAGAPQGPLQVLLPPSRRRLRSSSDIRPGGVQVGDILVHEAG